KEIREKIELLAQNPHIGADRGEDLKEGIRSILVGSHIIYYVYDAKTLTVWAVLHQFSDGEIITARLMPEQRKSNIPPVMPGDFQRVSKFDNLTNAGISLILCV
ncbi:MAG: type II toxin-antitoxin system RelE/ParE family toxin, partial [Treponema sp.]|nr:type II toxin-antitoxin system RelE/ParE family toxin [Treponema sp.]